MPNNQATAPLQLQQFSLEDFQTPEGIARFNQFITQHVKATNSTLGSAGPVSLPKGADLGGASIANVGGVGPQHTAISHAFAEANYSAAALGPQLEGNGKNALRTVRRVNDGKQQEKYSTFLNSVSNVAPTSNTSTISASGFTVTVSAGSHQRVDGSLVSYAQRSDTLTASSPIGIVSLTRTGGVVTAVTSSPSGVFPSDVITITGATDPTFDGTFTVATVVNPTTFTYAQSGIDASTTGGSIATGRVFFYFLENGSHTLSLSQPFDTDTQSNRIAANKDGSVLIAVVSVNGAGVDLTTSAAGATPPSANLGVHILTRL
jgi:hypothetical protein